MLDCYAIANKPSKYRAVLHTLPVGNRQQKGSANEQNQSIKYGIFYSLLHDVTNIRDHTECRAITRKLTLLPSVLGSLCVT